ncbi:MAG: chemotaxis protein, partial [Campylobacteraceae bacterium]|nr:chemotaxis protein [Campylobacteraceae bacterium]
MRLSIKGKLIALTVIPLLGLLYLTATKIYDEYQFKVRLDNVSVLVQVSKKLSLLIHETQKERGMSSGYTGSKGAQFVESLPKQHKLTDEILKEYQEFVQKTDLTVYPQDLQTLVLALEKDLKALPEVRSKVKSLALPLAEVVKWYTDMNGRMLRITAFAASISPENEISKTLIGYTAYLESKERAGIERAVLSGTFGADRFAPGMFARVIRLIAEQDAYLDTFLDNASEKIKTFYLDSMKDESIAAVERMREIAITNASTGGFGVDAEVWFATITKKINLLKEVDDRISSEIDAIMEGFTSNSM